MKLSQLEKKYTRHSSLSWKIYTHFHYYSKNYFSRGNLRLPRLIFCIGRNVLLMYHGSETGFSSALGWVASEIIPVIKRPGALEMRARRLSVLWTLVFYWFNLSPAKLVRSSTDIQPPSGRRLFLDPIVVFPDGSADVAVSEYHLLSLCSPLPSLFALLYQHAKCF